jgi:hypothetical protein
LLQTAIPPFQPNFDWAIHGLSAHPTLDHAHSFQHFNQPLDSLQEHLEIMPGSPEGDVQMNWNEENPSSQQEGVDMFSVQHGAAGHRHDHLNNAQAVQSGNVANEGVLVFEPSPTGLSLSSGTADGSGQSNPRRSTSFSSLESGERAVMGVFDSVAPMGEADERGRPKERAQAAGRTERSLEGGMGGMGLDTGASGGNGAGVDGGMRW